VTALSDKGSSKAEERKKSYVCRVSARADGGSLARLENERKKRKQCVTPLLDQSGPLPKKRLKGKARLEEERMEGEQRGK